jgi:hypothetical protein
VREVERYNGFWEWTLDETPFLLAVKGLHM